MIHYIKKQLFDSQGIPPTTSISNIMFLNSKLSASNKLRLCICTVAVLCVVSTPSYSQEEFDLDFSEDGGEIQQLLPDGDDTEMMDSSAADAPMEDDAAESDLPDGITVVDEMEQMQPAEDLPAPQDPAADLTVPDIPRTQTEETAAEENLFYDAEQLVPESELSRTGTPIQVNPVFNPGTRLVITRKTANPGSREAQLVAAERASKLGRFESALEIYNGLYAKNSRDPNILLGRAITLQRLGRIDEAINAYEEILDIRPNNLEAQINMQGLLGQRYPAVARRNLMDMFRENPGNVPVLAQLAMVEAKLGNHTDAIKFLGIAASIEPNNANHIFNMAIVADRAGEKKHAIEYYEQALEIDTLYGAGKSIPRDSVFQRLAELR